MRTRASISGWPARLETETVGTRCLRIYAPADLESRLDRERLLHDETYAPPYWALLWSGSRELARYLDANADLQGRRALEVGCGLGLVALSAASAGAQVTAIDRDAAAIEFLRASAALNGVAIEALVGDPTVLGGRRFDAVLAAELLYDREGLVDLAAVLVGRIAPGGALWIADAERIDTRAFFAEITRLGLVSLADETREVREEGTRVRVRIRGYRLGVTR
jgi:predicted nicotinamide N-methyase